MDELRQRTRAAHDLIEREPPFAAVLSHHFTLVDYGGLLLTLRGFYEQMERDLFQNLPEPLAHGVAHRRKTGLIARDIAALRLSGAADPQGARAVDASGWSVERKMGGLYVLEGATLGGRVIRRHLLRRFGPEIERALAFYGCYGASTGAEWAAFRDLMARSYDSRPEQIEDVVDGALDVFASLRAWVGAEQAPT
jgi:heme oxygenase